jgi:hypothetical protein
MGLPDSGPHTVEIFMEIETEDHRGNIVRIPDEDNPITVRNCWMQPVASTRGAFAALKVDQGQDVMVAYKFIARRAPIGWWSRVEWVDPLDGRRRKFAVLGGPQQRQYTPASTHVSCTLQEMR